MRFTFTISIFIYIFYFLLCGDVIACEFKIEECIQKIEKKEPQLHEILNVIFEVEDLSRNRIFKLNDLRRKAAYLPQVQLSYYQNFKESRSLSIGDNISVTSSGINIGPNESDFDRDLNKSYTFQVRASWKLGDVIFNSQSLQIYRFSQSLTKEREFFRSRISQIYFERRNKQILLLMASDKSKKIVYRQKIKELTDILDEYTQLKFNHEWWSL